MGHCLGPCRHMYTCADACSHVLGVGGKWTWLRGRMMAYEVQATGLPNLSTAEDRRGSTGTAWSLCAVVRCSPLDF